MSDEQPEQTDHRDPQAGESILDTLRAMRERKITENPRRTALDVPGYEGKVAVVYGWPDGGLEPIKRSVRHEQQAKTLSDRVDGAADLLIACCVTLAGRDADGALVDVETGAPFDLEAGDLPVSTYRFSRQLGEKLGMSIPNEAKNVPRLVCRQLFSPRGAATGEWDGDLALTQSSDVLYAWLVGIEEKADEAVAGE